MNSLGARWHNGVQLGRRMEVESEWLQPLNLRQSLFINPQVRLSREQQDLYDDGDRVARYKLKAGEARVEGGAAFGNWGDWRLGLKASRTDYEVDTGIRLLPESSNVDAIGWTSRLRIDTRDSAFVPTRGSYLDLNFFAADKNMGSQTSHQRGELFAQHVMPFRDDLLYVQLSAGSDFSSGLPNYDLFTAGGAGQLAGFELEELRGREYAFGRLAYLWKVTDLQTLLGQALYAGVSLEAGNMYDRIDNTSASGAILGSSLFFGGRTPLGPLLVTFGLAEGGHRAAYIQLGRPLEER